MQKYVSTQFSEIMVDLETLGTTPTASILSIGAVKFNLTDLDTEEDLQSPERCFYVEIISSDWTSHGRVIEADTVEWWMKQSEEARKIFADRPEKLSAVTALAMFYKFVSENSEKVRLWANGINFDTVLLRNLVAAIGTKLPSFPVPYWSEMDVRTLVKLAENFGGMNRSSVKKIGVHHNALDDARYQVLLVQEACRRLNPNKSSRLAGPPATFLSGGGAITTSGVITSSAADEALFLDDLVNISPPSPNKKE